MFNKNFANDWIRTADLWCRKRPLYHLSHNHFPVVYCYAAKLLIPNQSNRRISVLKTFPYSVSDYSWLTTSFLHPKFSLYLTHEYRRHFLLHLSKRFIYLLCHQKSLHKISLFLILRVRSRKQHLCGFIFTILCVFCHSMSRLIIFIPVTIDYY